MAKIIVRKIAKKNNITSKQVSHPLDIYELPSDKLFEVILNTAIVEGAKAVHFEYVKTGGLVRLRYRGRLHDVYHFDRSHFVALIKYLSNYFGFDELYKLPQTSRLECQVATKSIHLNASWVKLGNFESRLVIVLNAEFDSTIADLGISKYNQSLLLKSLSVSSGAIIVATRQVLNRKKTLFALAKQAVNEEKKLVSIEQNIDFCVPACEQIQLRPEIGFNLETALRAVVAQDCDVVIIDEVRKQAELEMALHLSMSGKRVFVGLALDGLNDVFRYLRYIDTDLDLLFGTVDTIVVTREIRRLCPKCSKSTSLESVTKELAASELSNLPVRAQKFLKKELAGQWLSKAVVGCVHCHKTGYVGTESLSEVAMLNGKIQKMLKNSGKLSLADILETKSLIGLRQDAIIRAVGGTVDFRDALNIDKYI